MHAYHTTASEDLQFCAGNFKNTRECPGDWPDPPVDLLPATHLEETGPHQWRGLLKEVDTWFGKGDTCVAGEIAKNLEVALLLAVVTRVSGYHVGYVGHVSRRPLAVLRSGRLVRLDHEVDWGEEYVTWE